MADIIGIVVEETLHALNHHQQAIKTPTLKPNKNLGEGTATAEEVAYRQEIIDFLKPVITQFNELKNRNYPLSDKDITDGDKLIDNIIQVYVSSVQQVVRKHVTSQYQNGWSKMYGHLTDAGVNPPVQRAIQPRLRALLKQQLDNVEDIGYRLRGRLKQIVNLKDVRSYYQQSPKNFRQDINTTKKKPVDTWDDDLDSAINEAQNNSDMLGLYGFVEAATSGFLQAGLFATTALAGTTALLIEIPWETQGDENVCDDCEALDGQTFSIWDYPGYPHFGCRCYPGDPIISFG